jgi:hypothetical protein
LKINVAFEVPDSMVKPVKVLSKMTKLSKDQIGQRLVDKLLPRLVAGELDSDGLMSMSTMLETFPELGEAMKRLGLDPSDPEEVVRNLSTAIFFMSVADKVVEYRS